MLTSSLLLSAAGIPAALVATGVLGALGIRLRMRSAVRDMTSRAALPDAITIPVPEEVSLGVIADDEPKRAAMQLLDAWSARPRSAWSRVGERMLQTSHAEAGAMTASELILEGVLAYHALAVDAWMVRDAADTAWFMAPRDEEPLSPAIGCAARRVVANAALALLAQTWLPVEDFERISRCIAT